MKVAIIQNRWKENVKDNKQHVFKLIEQSCEKNTLDFICLPEFFLGPPWYQPGQSNLKGITDDEIPGTITDELSNLARKYCVNIICGTIVERFEDKYLNTSVYIDSSGKIVGKASKVHTFAAESVVCQAGDNFNVFPSSFGDIGIAVCSDFWILECPRILALKGAKIIFVPGGSLKQNIKANMAVVEATAYLNNVIVVYASPLGKVIGMRGGKQIEIEYIGHSMIASPHTVLTNPPNEKESILIAEIDDQYLKVLNRNENNNDSLSNINLRNCYDFSDITISYVNIDRDINKEFLERMA